MDYEENLLVPTPQVILRAKDDLDLVDFEVPKQEFVLPSPIFLHFVTPKAKLQELDNLLVLAGFWFE